MRVAANSPYAGLRSPCATPNATKSRRRTVSYAQSSAIVELLSAVSNLASEPIILVGVLEEADCVRGKWRLATEDAKVGSRSLVAFLVATQVRSTCPLQ